jgi:hypothetical protein
MRPRNPLVLITFVPFLWLAMATAAHAACDAAPGTAAVDQYCETLPTADGMTNATAEHLVPLASVLPKGLVRRLERSGVLGQALLALPAVPRASSSTAAGAAARKATADPRLGSLLPGEPRTMHSVLKSTLDTANQVGQGFVWTLVLSLLALAGVSLVGSLRGWSVR